MLQFKVFTFNEFQENCYLVHNEESGFIFDPGCRTPSEFEELTSYVDKHNLNVTKLINTHCHLDHIFGNHFIYDQYGLKPWIHEEELFFLENLNEIAAKYGIAATPSPEPEGFISENTKLYLDNTQIRLFFTPGHSPGSLSFYFEQEKNLLVGDVLFRNSIGRTDLPGGDFSILKSSIVHLYDHLSDDTTVLSGHGPATSIGYERYNNPFVRQSSLDT